MRQVVPMHYGTFPALTGTPDMLRETPRRSAIEVLELEPGEDDRSSCAYVTRKSLTATGMTEARAYMLRSLCVQLRRGKH